MKKTEAQKDYAELHALSKKVRTLEGISHLLEWDQETFMPPDAAAFRAEQIQMLAGIIHKDKTGKKFANTLAKLVDLKSGKVKAAILKEDQKAALRRWQRDYRIDTSLPNTFVEELAKLSSQALEVWKSARENNAFQQFAPYLERIVEMCR